MHGKRRHRIIPLNLEIRIVGEEVVKRYDAGRYGLGWFGAVLLCTGDPFEVRPRFTEQVYEFRLRDGKARPGMADEVAHFLDGRPRIGCHHDRAEGCAGMVGNQEFRAIVRM